MANQEHLDLLKQGVKLWNKWRVQNRTTWPDLEEANLIDVDLSGANLSGANLSRAILDEANLSGANLNRANLSRTMLSHTMLSRATLSHATLIGAAFTDGTTLDGADFSEALVWLTIFGDVNLSQVKGLETMKFEGKSYVDIHTIYRSGGNIPEAFLRGIGAPDTMIEYMRSLVGKPIDYYSCFISYSSKDHAFIDRLYADLQHNGVRCWLDREDLKIGDEIHPHIDEAIRLHDKLLLVLSKHALASSWVEREVESAFEQERRHNKLVLFPIRLDATVLPSEEAWAADIRRMRYIGDFTKWKQHDEYQRAFQRLLRDLKAGTQQEQTKAESPRTTRKADKNARRVSE